MSDDRRSQPRLLDSDLILISWKESAGRVKQLANVEDVSLNGLGVVMDQLLPLHTKVTISYGEEELTGVVRHCHALENGYFVGIEFDQESRNSTAHFQPDLLIRL